MKTYKIHLIRHGLTEGNLEGRYIGRTDLPLCAQGEERLRLLVDSHAYPDAERVYAPAQRRCLQTAAILYPGRETHTVDALREMDFGEFEGRTLASLKSDPVYLQWIEQNTKTEVPGGEPGAAFSARCRQGFEAVLSDMMKNGVFSAAVVIPGGVLLSVLTAFSIDRRPFSEWVVGDGRGYTTVVTPQLWMYDKVFEVRAPVPAPLPNSEESGANDA